MLLGAALLTPNASLAQTGGQTTAPADALDKKVSLNLENADIRYALKLLFNSAGVDYTVDQGVQGFVTVSLSDKPFKVALQAVLRGTTSALPLTYRVENGVYNVLPKGDIEPDATAASTTETAETKTTSSRFRRLMTTRHLDVYSMGYMLSQLGVSVTMMIGRMGELCKGTECASRQE